MIDWASVTTSFATGVAGSLITIYLTPRLQHKFWKNQRREELRLAAINKMNGLMSDFVVLVTDIRTKGASDAPMRDFYVKLEEAHTDVRTLFTGATLKEFEKLEVMFRALLDCPKEAHRQTVKDFNKAKDAALLAMYKETGIIK